MSKLTKEPYWPKDIITLIMLFYLRILFQILATHTAWHLKINTEKHRGFCIWNIPYKWWIGKWKWLSHSGENKLKIIITQCLFFRFFFIFLLTRTMQSSYINKFGGVSYLALFRKQNLTEIKNNYIILIQYG